MSYIKEKFSQTIFTPQIYDFCKREGFEVNYWDGKKCLMYVTRGESYNVWVMIFPSKISYYVEYECGGEVESGARGYYDLDTGNFLNAYHMVINSLAHYITEE